MLAGAFFAVAYVAMVLIAAPVGLGWTACPTWYVAGLGMGLAMPSVGVLLLEWSPPEQRGKNSAAMQVSDVIAAALCIGAGGVLVAAAENGLLPLPVAVGVVDLGMAVLAVSGAILAHRARAEVRADRPQPVLA